ncbi:hypothetical protein FIBSPDRAFT_859800, partial [Athelia psychrophila]
MQSCSRSDWNGHLHSVGCLLGCLEDCTAIENTPAEAHLLVTFANLVELGGLPKIFPEIHRVKFANKIWNIACLASSAPRVAKVIVPL